MCLVSPPRAAGPDRAVRTPARTDDDIRNAAEEARRLARLRRGRNVTILTGGLGDSGFGRAGGPRTLLGG